MADDKSKTGGQGRACVHVNEPYEPSRSTKYGRADDPRAAAMAAEVFAEAVEAHLKPEK